MNYRTDMELNLLSGLVRNFTLLLALTTGCVFSDISSSYKLSYPWPSSWNRSGGHEFVIEQTWNWTASITNTTDFVEATSDCFARLGTELPVRGNLVSTTLTTVTSNCSGSSQGLRLYLAAVDFALLESFQVETRLAVYVYDAGDSASHQQALVQPCNTTLQMFLSYLSFLYPTVCSNTTLKNQTSWLETRYSLHQDFLDLRRLPWCDSGMFADVFNQHVQQCYACLSGTFQPLTGRFTQCQNCPNGTWTKTDGAVNSSQCDLVLCRPGEGNTNGTRCYPCERGWWNSGNDTQRLEECSPCPDGHSTKTEGATSYNDCLPVCGPGEETNGTICMPCAAGWWNSGNDTQKFETCAPCPPGHSTQTAGATSLDDCLLTCFPGYGVNGTICSFCQRGWWNTGNDSQKFEECTLCPFGFSTKYEGATGADQCLPVCGPGEESNGTKCLSCARGWWNSGNDTQRFEPCAPCPPDFSTRTTGATNQDECLLTCPPGHGTHGSTCSPCQLGWWNGGNDTQKFLPCTPCPAGYITRTENATHPDNCTRDCQAGSYIDTTRCVPCAVGTFQPDKWKYSCTPCPDGTTTAGTGSTTVRQCINKPDLSVTASMTMTYTLVVLCTEEQAGRLSAIVRTRIVSLSTDWPDLCADVTCSNTDVTASCPSLQDKAVVVLASLHNLPPILSGSKQNLSLTPQAIFLNSQTQFQTIQELGAIRTDFSFLQTLTCTNGLVMHNQNCQEEAKGDTLMTGVLAGSITGGLIGLVVLILLVLLVCRVYRGQTMPEQSKSYNKTDYVPEHGYTGLNQAQRRAEEYDYIPADHTPWEPSSAGYLRPVMTSDGPPPSIAADRSMTHRADPAADNASHVPATSTLTTSTGPSSSFPWDGPNLRLGAEYVRAGLCKPPFTGLSLRGTTLSSTDDHLVQPAIEALSLAKVDKTRAGRSVIEGAKSESESGETFQRLIVCDEVDDRSISLQERYVPMPLSARAHNAVPNSKSYEQNHLTPATGTNLGQVDARDPSLEARAAHPQSAIAAVKATRAVSSGKKAGPELAEIPRSSEAGKVRLKAKQGSIYYVPPADYE